MVKLRADRISKKYYVHGDQYEALKDVSVSVEEGDFICIVGKSGAGKSTLLYILSGIKSADSGEVLIDGNAIHKMRDSELSRLHGLDMGIVFQDGRLIDDMTVFDNIALPGYLYRNRRDVEADVLRLLQGFRLEDQKDKTPDGLSAGQKQRIALARALINRPSILFLDEPTGNLDLQTGEWIYAHLKTLNQNGTTIVMVTHDIHAASLCKKVWILSYGRVKDNIVFMEAENSENERKNVIISRMYEMP